MDLVKYFEDADGFGILSTADDAGNVDAAIYAKPQVIDNDSIILVMREKLSHHNIQRNPKAIYTFIEDVPTNRGVRLYLSMKHEETNQSLAKKIIEQQPEICPFRDDSNKYVVCFNVERVRQLVGDKSL